MWKEAQRDFQVCNFSYAILDDRYTGVCFIVFIKRDINIYYMYNGILFCLHDSYKRTKKKKRIIIKMQ